MDNFDLKKYISEGKIHLQEVVVDRTQFTIHDSYDSANEEAKKTNSKVFELENGDIIVDPNFDKYHKGTQEIMFMVAEQGHEWVDVENYFDAVEGHEAAFKKYPNDLDKIPNEALNNEAFIYGDDYEDFY